MRPRRINLFGGPGSGKSTMASWLFAELKRQGLQVQLVDEFCKRWAYEGRKIQSFDQVYLLAKQLGREDAYLRAGVDLVVTDAPLLLMCSYSERNGDPFAPALFQLALEFERVFPSVNVLLERDVEYQTQGRYEDQAGAMSMDQRIRSTLKRLEVPFVCFKTTDQTGVLAHVLAQPVGWTMTPAGVPA